MALSSVTYTGNGVQTDFTLTFPYISKTHVVCSVNALVTAHTWVNATTVRISPAPAGGSTVKLERSTPKSPLTNFSDGDGGWEGPLDTLALQTVYLLQEQQDQIDGLVLGGVATLPGTSVTISPTGTVASTNAQSAIGELASEKVQPAVIFAGSLIGTQNDISYSFSGDTDTGLFSPSSDRAVLIAGNVWSLVVDPAAVQVYGSLSIVGPSGILSISEQTAVNGTDSFTVYGGSGNLYIYSNKTARNLASMDHNGNFNVAGTSPSTEGIFDFGNRVFSKTSVSSPAAQNYTGQGRYNFAHGLSAKPTLWQVFARCLIAEHGYAVGDEISIDGASTGTASCSSSADTTNVSVSIYNNLSVPAKAGTSFVNLTTTGPTWELLIRAWK